MISIRKPEFLQLNIKELSPFIFKYNNFHFILFSKINFLSFPSSPWVPWTLEYICEWMEQGKTVLIMKNPAKGHYPVKPPNSVYELIWNWLLKCFVTKRLNPPDEQKGSKIDKFKDQLLIDKLIPKYNF